MRTSVWYGQVIGHKFEPSSIDPLQGHSNKMAPGSYLPTVRLDQLFVSTEEVLFTVNGG